MPKRRSASGGREAAWTVMVYLCGDNDLEPSAVADMREMKRVGSSDDVHVLVQFDRYHAGMPTRRYRIRKGTSLRGDAVGPALGETNTGWLPEERPLPGTLRLYQRLAFVRNTAWGRFVKRYARA